MKDKLLPVLIATTGLALLAGCLGNLPETP
jgi:hypothetical protein